MSEIRKNDATHVRFGPLQFVESPVVDGNVDMVCAARKILPDGSAGAWVSCAAYDVNASPDKLQEMRECLMRGFESDGFEPCVATAEQVEPVPMQYCLSCGFVWLGDDYFQQKGSEAAVNADLCGACEEFAMSLW